MIKLITTASEIGNAMRLSFIDQTVEFINSVIEDHCENVCEPDVCMGDDCQYKQGMLHVLEQINEQR